MADAAYWVMHAAVAFLGFLLLGVSIRAALTVFCALGFELIGFIGMVVPGASDVLFTLELFALLGLAMGLLLSLPRQDLPWWLLPALAGGVLVLLRLTLLLGEDWATIRGNLPMEIAAVSALAAGMLAGRGIAEVGTRAWSRVMSRFN